ncbi:hypothetical protein CORC01_08526 [Colletotrichum orchidophilum]|uniref:Gag1-like clamp domain-containing protein n=1 Tax=Colletotrichum orchidophilum TaxID=1209926 RepID=A0A1G4B3Z1_9PEZI|nr:uncharacterized protein CORC01_08526 [Colletotrichum orchidophilum]OHE96149.1 hypothetical protein CORC01_08526 [Colletotrichum orchidophilum]
MALPSSHAEAPSIATSMPSQRHHPTSASASASASDSSAAAASYSSSSSAPRGCGDEVTAPPPSDQAPWETNIRPPAAATTTPVPVPDPDIGALQLHHIHQPTPQATATETATATAATPALASTPTATLPEASLARLIKRTAPDFSSLDAPPMPPISPSSSAAPSANPPSKTDPHPSSSNSKMLFSDMYKSPRSPLAKFRLSMSQQPLALDLPEYDPELLSKDKEKQKAAVKKYLTAKIRNDWEFVWPPVVSPPQNGDAAPDMSATPEQETAEKPQQESPEPKVEATATSNDEAIDTIGSEEEEEEDSDAESVYSTVSEDAAHFKPRLEWVSDLSDEDPPLSLSPFRFDSPDAIGATVKASIADKRARRRRALREEMEWNEGLACFEARRNAWTGARTVRVRTKPVSPTQTFSPLSPRRLFFRSSFSHPQPAPASPASPAHSLQQRVSNEASAAVSDGSELSKAPSKELTAQKSKESQKSTASPTSTTYPVETLVPIPAPLLPPGNPMRASITPSVYISLYEKVIVHALTPSCPVNLSDMIRACVVGWKRDGEWPPKPSAAEPGIVAVRRRKKSVADGQGPNPTRRMSFGFLGRGEKAAEAQDDSTGKGIRKSLQRVLGLGHHHTASTASANGGNNGA